MAHFCHPLPSRDDSDFMWADGSFFSNDLKDGFAAAAMWVQGYESSTLITSAPSHAKTLNFPASDYVSRSIHLYSDSLSSLSNIFSSYWKSSLSDTKLRLLRAFRRVCQVSTSTLVDVRDHSGIRQNEILTHSLSKFYSPPTPLTSTLTSLQRLGSQEPS